MSEKPLPRLGKKLDNTIGEVGSWHKKEIVRLNVDGKTIHTEPYQARYISSAEIAADQDSSLTNTPPYQLREGTPGSFNSLIRASASDRVVPSSSESEDNAMEGEQQRFVLNTNGNSYIYEPYVINSEAVPGAPEIHVTPAAQAISGSSAPTGRSQGRVYKSQAPQKFRRQLSPSLTPDRLPTGPKPPGRASTPGEARLADITNSIELRGLEAGLGIDSALSHGRLPNGSHSPESMEGIHKVEQRRDSAVPTIETKSSASGDLQGTTFVQNNQASPVARPAMVPGPVHVPYTKRSRGLRNMLNELEVSGTSQMAPTGTQGGSKEMVYRSYDGKIYKYCGNEDPEWIVAGPWEKNKVPKAASSRPFVGRRSASARISSPASTRNHRSRSRGI